MLSQKLSRETYGVPGPPEKAQQRGVRRGAPPEKAQQGDIRGVAPLKKAQQKVWQAEKRMVLERKSAKNSVSDALAVIFGIYAKNDAEWCQNRTKRSPVSTFSGDASLQKFWIWHKTIANPAF